MRFTSSSYGHRIRFIAAGIYRLEWGIDRRIKGSRLRHPTSFKRVADEAGARRFAKRWSIKMPEIV
jgi:hypothetical protein